MKTISIAAQLEFVYRINDDDVERRDFVASLIKTGEQEIEYGHAIFLDHKPSEQQQFAHIIRLPEPMLMEMMMTQVELKMVNNILDKIARKILIDQIVDNEPPDVDIQEYQTKFKLKFPEDLYPPRTIQ